MRTNRKMNMRRMARVIWLGGLLLVSTACAKDVDAALPKLKLEPSRVAVAGLSSGAYMATQVQLAYPELFPNAAMVAGGPYGCAGGKLDVALSTCMKGAPAPDVDVLVAHARQRACLSSARHGGHYCGTGRGRSRCAFL